MPKGFAAIHAQRRLSGWEARDGDKFGPVVLRFLRPGHVVSTPVSSASSSINPSRELHRLKLCQHLYLVSQNLLTGILGIADMAHSVMDVGFLHNVFRMHLQTLKHIG